MTKRVYVWLGIASFALSVATALLWHRSTTTLDSIELTRTNGTYVTLQTWPPGWLRLAFAHNAPPPYGWRINPYQPHGRLYTFFPSDGFIYGLCPARGTIANWFTAEGRLIANTNTPYRAVVLSELHLMLLSAMLSVVLLILAWRKKPFATGRCAHCGYDLRASPDRCPECGTEPSESSPATK